MIYFGLFLAVSCCCGILIAENAHFPAWWWLSGCGLSITGAAALRNRRVFSCVFLLIIIFCLGAWRFQQVSDDYAVLPFYLTSETLYMEGNVEGIKSTYETDKGGMTKYVVALSGFSYKGESVLRSGTGRLYVALPSEPQWVVSSRIGFTGKIRPITYYKNAGMYDAMHRDVGEKIIGTVYGDEGSRVQLLREPSGWPLFSSNLREMITQHFMTVLNTEKAYLLSSLLFGGHYSDLPKSLLNSFSVTGMIHILSVSGSHVSLLLGVVQLLGRLIGMRERSLFAASAVLVVCYGALSDFTSPVVRSVIMGLISAYSLAARRNYTGFHALAVAVLGMVLYNPYVLYDLSFRLSCGASAGIVLLQSRVRHWLSFLPRFLGDSFAVCISAQVLLLPLLLSAFFSFPVYSALANLTVGPVLDLSIILGLAAAVFGFLFPPVQTILLWMVNILLELAVTGNYFIADLPYSRLWIGALSFPAVISYYLAAAAVFFLPRLRRPLLATALLIMVGHSGWVLYHKADVTLYVFDMGNDRATCGVYSDSSVRLWYNKSQWSNPEQIAGVLTPALRHEGIFRIDQVYVGGYEAKRTIRQLREQLAIGDIYEVPAAEKGKGIAFQAVPGDLPYYIYDALPQGNLPQPACLEIRSLRYESGKTVFPKQAAALIVFRSGKGDAGWENWQEEASYYDIPCFSPFLDGEIIALYRKGKWKFSSYGSELF